MKNFNILAPIMIFLTKAFMNEQISVDSVEKIHKTAYLQTFWENPYQT